MKRVMKQLEKNDYERERRATEGTSVRFERGLCAKRRWRAATDGRGGDSSARFRVTAWAVMKAIIERHSISPRVVSKFHF